MVDNEKITNRDLDDEIRIDLLELIATFFKKLHIIILVGILFASVAFLGTTKISSPQYVSTAKMYVSLIQVDSSALSYRGMDYVELVKSRPVLEETIERLRIDMSVDALKAAIAVQAPQETRVITVQVTNSDPQLAMEIADAVREIASERIVQNEEVASVDMVEEASNPVNLSPSNAKKYAVIAGFLGCLLAVGIILISYIVDDTIKTVDDVERYLGVNVLASVQVNSCMNKEDKCFLKRYVRSRK